MHHVPEAEQNKGQRQYDAEPYREDEKDAFAHFGQGYYETIDLCRVLLTTFARGSAQRQPYPGKSEMRASDLI